MFPFPFALQFLNVFTGANFDVTYKLPGLITIPAIKSNIIAVGIPRVVVSVEINPVEQSIEALYFSAVIDGLVAQRAPRIVWISDISVPLAKPSAFG